MPSYGASPKSANIRVTNKTKVRHVLFSPLILPFLPLWAVWKFFELIYKAISLATAKDPIGGRR